MSKISLSDFKIMHAICEVRYDDAFELWDRAGSFWSSCKGVWPDLNNKRAEPNITSFSVGNNLDLTVQVNRAHLKNYYPNSSLQDFTENVSNFTGLVCSHLDISAWNRVGFRINFKKEFESLDSFNEYVKGLDELAFHNKKHFGIEPTHVLPSRSVRFEGETLGIRGALEYHKKSLDVEIPFDVNDLKPINQEYHQFIIDYDYYTLKPAKIGQLKIAEWIELAFRAIKRDHESFWSSD